MGLIRKLVHILAVISYVLIIVYAIVCIPMIFGHHPVVVLSGSMKPTYKVGSVIYYKKVSQKELKVGDYLLGSDNKYHKIKDIIHYHNEDLVYNIEVENNHNYYVGNNGYLVHNKR